MPLKREILLLRSDLVRRAPIAVLLDQRRLVGAPSPGRGDRARARRLPLAGGGARGAVGLWWGQLSMSSADGRGSETYLFVRVGELGGRSGAFGECGLVVLGSDLGRSLGDQRAIVPHFRGSRGTASVGCLREAGVGDGGEVAGAAAEAVSRPGGIAREDGVGSELIGRRGDGGVEGLRLGLEVVLVAGRRAGARLRVLQVEGVAVGLVGRLLRDLRRDQRGGRTILVERIGGADAVVAVRIVVVVDVVVQVGARAGDLRERPLLAPAAADVVCDGRGRGFRPAGDLGEEGRAARLVLAALVGTGFGCVLVALRACEHVNGRWCP